MNDYIIGYFSRRNVFHIVAYRDSAEEVQAFLKKHNRGRLIVYAAQQLCTLDTAPVSADESEREQGASQ